MPAKIKQQDYLQEVISRVAATPPIVPLHRKAYKQGYSFSQQPFDAQLQIWNNIWKQTDAYWVRLQAFFFLEQYVARRQHHLLIWDTSVSWQEDVNDWSLCDALAKINTKALETFPKEVYTQLSKWNSDKDLWKRRQSVVSLLYFSRTKKEYLPSEKITALIQPLLTDNEYYVQKGVGWALRELHTVYPADAILFLKKHIKQIHPIAFTIAIEKMTAPEKESFKLMRRK